MKNFKVLWAKSAKNDLEEIIEYIKIDDIDAAKNIFLAIKSECNELYYFPEKFRVVPELHKINILQYREVIYKRWRVVYKIVGKKVYILFVVDTSRNVEDVLLQRLLNQ
ncbi:MAG: type II toxin-antitoxin system RelE/ParE family toxin [Proteobacteria bacterium]|nr:type II toxin-antitoxin system RelE/ParE family toxin [Pseudomonadota bacterium]MCH9711035.1 type II toxin-antitoxin system RelE/ParE family toxin [Pseudomonadota bacterium]MCH9749414.1 type II toxin-antitoxin system RelE/ParE family toxin [Pseudomonadota bacterium]